MGSFLCNTAVLDADVLEDRYSLPMAARTTKLALVGGVVYGGLQDLAGAARGRTPGYVVFVKRHLGLGQNASQPPETTETTP